MHQLTKEQFIKEMVAHYDFCCGTFSNDYEHAKEVLDNRLATENIQYGDIRYSWDIHDAQELANADMSSWGKQNVSK